MPLFDVPKRAGREQDKQIANKSKAKAKKAPTTVKGSGLLSKIIRIQEVVDKYLGKYKEEYRVITKKHELAEYIQFANSRGIIAIDTETTGLDPMLDKIVGLCLYVPNQKAVYVPINHVSYITNERAENQLVEDEVAEELVKLTAKVVMFNANFDNTVQVWH